MPGVLFQVMRRCVFRVVFNPCLAVGFLKSMTPGAYVIREMVSVGVALITRCSVSLCCWLLNNSTLCPLVLVEELILQWCNPKTCIKVSYPWWCYLPLSLLQWVLKKYAHGYLPSLPIFYVFTKRGEYIKDTFGQAHHWKLARRVGCTSHTPCSSVSRSHDWCSHQNHSFLTCISFTSFSVLILLNHDE